MGSGSWPVDTGNARLSLLFLSDRPGRMFISCVSLPPTSSLGSISISSLTDRSEKDEGHTARLGEALLSLEVDVMTCRRKRHRGEYDTEECRQSYSSGIGRGGRSYRHPGWFSASLSAHDSRTTCETRARLSEFFRGCHVAFGCRAFGPRRFVIKFLSFTHDQSPAVDSFLSSAFRNTLCHPSQKG